MPLSKILPPPEPGRTYYLMTLRDGRAGHRKCASVAELEDGARILSQQCDCYFALCAYREDSDGRKAANAVCARSLWADIDIGKAGCRYASQEEALTSLLGFSQSTGLYPTVIISSGLGLHVYWTFTQDIPIPEWRELASLFHALCSEQGLDVDPSRAEDPASVLRIPGTLHHKSGNPVTVMLDRDPWNVADFLKLLGSHLKAVPRPATPNVVTSPFGTALDSPKKPSCEGVIANCKQVANMGAAPYQAWYGAMTVLKRCEGGEDAVHELSSHDPRYDPQHCARIYASAPNDAPATCEYFRRHHPDGCEGCGFDGVVRSPVSLHNRPAPAPEPEREPEPEAPQSDHLVVPDRWTHPRMKLVSRSFVVDSRGIVRLSSKKVKQADGTVVFQDIEEVISRTQLHLKCRVVIEDDRMRPRQGFLMEAEYADGRKRDLIFMVDEDLGAGKLQRWLHNSNIFFTVRPDGTAYTEKDFMGFMNALLTELADKAPVLPTFDKFGWQQVENADGSMSQGFVTGVGLVTADGVKEISPGKMLKHHIADYGRKGDLGTWKYFPQMYRVLNQPVGQLAVCLSFAAPLMRYGMGEAKSSIYSIWSAQSGLGKSHLLRVCASIWGDPYKQFFSRQESTVARARRLSILNNIPAFLDELTDVKDEDLYGLAYTLAGGKEKNKLRSTGDEFVKTGEWSTTVFSTANKAYKEAIARCAGDSEATLQRIMEVECEFPSYAGDAQVMQYINGCTEALAKHYGHAGPEFMYQLLRRPERLDTLTARAAHWCERVGFDSKERFMSYPLALALIAGRWAVEFGLLDYDMDALEKWVVSTFVTTNRESTRSMSVSLDDLFGEYVAAKRGNMLVVRSERRSGAIRNAPMSKEEPDGYILSRPPDASPVHMRYNAAERSLEVSFEDLSSWCRNRKVSFNVLFKHMNAVMHAAPQIRQDNLGRWIRWLPPTRIKILKFAEADLRALGFDVDAYTAEDAG